MKKFNWGWGVIAIFVLFTSGTVTWVAFAMTKEVDLVRPDYYQQSMKHDATMSARQNAKLLGSEAAMFLNSDTQMFVVGVPLAQAAASGTIKFYRPNSVASDRTITFSPNNQGTMSIPISKLARGAWQVTFDWNYNGKAYELTGAQKL
jgi:hypothetical protein